MSAPAEIEIKVRPIIMPSIEEAARAAQAALDDLPMVYESTPRQLHQRDRLGEILIHTARAHIEARKIEARLAAAHHLASTVSQGGPDAGAELTMLLSVLLDDEALENVTEGSL